MQHVLTSYFWSGDALRSRSVSTVVLTGTLQIPAPPARLLADWEREMADHLGLECGDVEALPLARARMRWPDYAQCVQAVAEWTQALGLPDLLGQCDVALMACRSARYHHDGAQYGGAAFCNLFLSEDKGQDLHFPDTGLRIPLVRGTAVVFDTGLAHAVIARGSRGFDAADFPPDQDCSQVFLTWELPIEDSAVGQVLGIAYDTDTPTARLLDEEQVWLNGAPTQLCPLTGIRTGTQLAPPR
ncbi:MAG: hypothetical protein CFE43_13985 [Burkholderiales bacterium PBB3]|nr:MAG: hypothetical protein CFE43_13985 [Burkholderiales bacterium PBB3]